jgi:hypothetical protein
MIDITKRHFRFRLGTHILKYTYYSKWENLVVI